MRIVAGRHRGRALRAPPGPWVRPTADRVRESLFNILAHGYGDGAEGPLPAGCAVLDAFAGSGALGLEALSRGAKRATFLEADGAARRALEANIAALGEAPRATVLSRDATRPGPARPGHDLAFLDPPYGKGLAAPALAALAAGWLTPGALVVIETGRDEIVDLSGQYELLQTRDYGRTRLWFCRYSS